MIKQTARLNRDDLIIVPRDEKQWCLISKEQYDKYGVSKAIRYSEYYIELLKYIPKSLSKPRYTYEAYKTLLRYFKESYEPYMKYKHLSLVQEGEVFTLYDISDPNKHKFLFESRSKDRLLEKLFEAKMREEYIYEPDEEE